MIIRYLQTLSVVLLSATSGALNFGFLPVQTTPICLMQTVMSTPSGIGNEPIMIDRIAWQLGTPSMPEPLTLNGQTPLTTAPELICIGGCPNPPCWPVLTCPVSDLYWSHLYENVVVPANSMMQLPDMQIAPPMLLVLYDAAPLPPTSSISPTSTRTPTSTSSPSPSATQSAQPTPSRTPSSPNILVAGAGAGGEPCNPHATPAAVVFGLLFGMTSLIIFGCWYRGQSAECPYCALRVAGGSVAIREHLKTCRDHLALFQPFAVETVRRLSMPPVHQQTIAVHVPPGEVVSMADEQEDLIARPEPSVQKGTKN